MTHKNIGAIARTFYHFDSDRFGYVFGVRDSELKGLRDTDFPTYIRLHTAGLESDYNLMNRAQSLYTLELEKKRMVFWEHLLRTTYLILYYASATWPRLSSDMMEEPDELKRDIVGHDVYGAIRHLHRPAMAFVRYTQYDDLTSKEKAFGRRVGYRSFLNLINPLLINQLQWCIHPDLKLSVGLGYTMSPFGDFIDENFWFVIKKKTKIHVYLRQFENKATWFWAGGMKLIGYPVFKRFECSTALHFWNQPANLAFDTSRVDFGGGVELLIKYHLFYLGNQPKEKKYVSVDVGMMAKTAGFLPEEMFLDKTLSFRLGCTFDF